MQLLKVIRKVARFFNLSRSITFAVAAILTWQLLLPPMVGLADNGDFAKLMVHFDLTHAANDWNERYFAFVDRHYRMDAAEASKYSPRRYFSSELIFAAIAFALDRIFSSSFDLLWLGVIHVAALAAATSFLLFSTRAFASRMRSIGFVIGLVAFTDIAYSAYFNSFYPEPATLLFFLAAAGCAYQAIGAGRRRLAWLGGYFLATAALVLAKYQNVVLLPIFLLFGALVVKRWDVARYFQAYVIFALAACYGGYLYFIASPEAVNEAALYNSVFNGILAGSPAPGADLTALGLDSGLARYAGSMAFEQGSPSFNPEFMQRFRQQVTMGSLLRFYLRRPGRLFAALARSIGIAFELRPKLGNYEKSAGYPPMTISRSWAMWSSVRSAILPRNMWFVFLIGILYLGLLARKWWQHRDRVSRLHLEWSALIPAMALAQLVVITVSDGISELIKHAYLFNLLCDYMLVYMLAQLLTWFFGISSRQEAEEANT